MKIYTKSVWLWQPDGTPKLVPGECESFDYEGPIALCKDSPSPPPAPDYVGAANAQGQGNVNTARVQGEMSNPNVTNPYGSRTVTFGTPGTFDQAAYDQAMQAYQQSLLPSVNPLTGDYRAPYSGPAPDRSAFYVGGDPNAVFINDTLSPSGQKLFDQYQNINLGLGDVAQRGLGYVQNMLDQPFDQSKLPAAPVSPGQSYIDAAFSRLQPNIDQQRAALDTQLSNQGIDVSSNPIAYENAKRIQNQAENDQRAAIVQSSIGQDEAARQAAIQEQSYFRNEPLNTLNAVRNAAPIGVPQFQGFQANANPQAGNIANAVNQMGQYQQGLYNADVATTNANNSAAYGLGTTALMALMFSDRRLKSNVVRIGDHPLGIGIYEYDIFGKRERGVMADEVLTVKPGAVHLHPSGYLMVDYGAL